VESVQGLTGQQTRPTIQIQILRKCCRTMMSPLATHRLRKHRLRQRQRLLKSTTGLPCSAAVEE
jgi:hypothetical protein